MTEAPKAKDNIIQWYLKPDSPLPDPLATIMTVRRELWDQSGRDDLNTDRERKLILKRLGMAA